MSLTPPAINPVTLDGLPLTFRPYQDVTSFTYRTGQTYLETLEAIRAWIPGVLVPFLSDNFNEFEDSWINNVDTLSSIVTQALNAQATTINTALAAQQAAVAQNLSDTLAGIVSGSSVPLYDAQVYAALESAGSTALALLDSRYATATFQTTIQALVDSGRLSGAALDSAYKFTDADLETILADGTSASHTYLDGKYGQRIEFQLSATALQFRYVGDTTWTDLVLLTEITGPSGPTGNPGGNAELAYAESTSTFTVPIDSTNAVMNDITGLNISLVMPSRPVLLEFGATVNYIGTSALNDPYIRLIETTGGGSTVVAEIHVGKQTDTNQYEPVYARRRITGTTGQTRTFKAVAVGRSNTSWKVAASPTYPAWIGASQC